MAEKSKRKRDCFHYWRGACRILDCLVCEERNCSFYEKPKDYIKRRAEFDKKFGPVVPKNGPKY